MSNACENCENGIWKEALDWYYQKEGSYGFLSNCFLKGSREKKNERICQALSPINNTLNDLLRDKNELTKLSKLYCFRESSGDILEQLKHHGNPQYKHACEFVNECLDIFRELKEKHCRGKTFKVKTGLDRNSSDSSSNTVCYQLEEFLDKYETVLYKDLEGRGYKHNKMSSLEQHPDAARVRCNLGEDLYYTPFFNIFKYNSRRLTPFGSIVFLIFSMLLMILMMHILVKFTPIGDRIHPRRAHVRRKWRDIQAEIYYPNSMGYYGDGSTYSDNSRFGESSTSDGSSMSNEGSTFYYSAPDGSSMSNEGSTFYYSTSDGSISSFGESNESDGNTRFDETSTFDGSSMSDSRSRFYYSSDDDGSTSTDGSFTITYRSARR
ncbi:hypothetical protein C922_05050 [Plasmodium inui San Antonio 1]|uniref:Uncharacterized protein n=1 Tax=Plasmodium inui San Antonio 1 TaxID=1237626 RepID=W7A682_9APIC|nr:hypothetical protein C922_05050 [Plasmodium inui San Antonio 1]EUD64579.1 hypothetical protein C922_05050 [Plasmodium inui San Antonio 1]